MGKNILESAAERGVPWFPGLASLLAMQQFYAAPFVKIVAELQYLETHVEWANAVFKSASNDDSAAMRATVSGEAAIRIRKSLSELRAACAAIDLAVVVSHIDELERQLTSDGIPRERFPSEIEHLRRNTYRALEVMLFFRIPTERAPLFATPQLFGPVVDAVFEYARKDIEEAGKCLGCGRGTAAVFHLMRIMESGLKHIAGRLGIPYAPSWESYIKQITEQIAVKHPNKTVDWRRDEPFFKDVLGDLV